MIETSIDSLAVNKPKEKIKILFYNKFWNFEYPDMSQLTQLNLPDIEFLAGKEHLQDADVVAFYIPGLRFVAQELKMMKKKQGQLWVYCSTECELHYPGFQKQGIFDLFDITATYQLDSDIPLPYITHWVAEPWRQEPAKKTAFINGFFSGQWNKSGRFDYLVELMSYLDIHSFGKTLNNKAIESDPYFSKGISGDSMSFKGQVIAKYKFTLAFENAIAKDYVTEKFFQPLVVGSVPIYLGAPNVEDFAPGDNCYINVNSFASVKELADYLLLLDSNDELYNEYLKWKKLPFRSGFESRLNLPSPDLIGRLVSLVRKKIVK